jgi:hypothetical protein
VIKSVQQFKREWSKDGYFSKSRYTLSYGWDFLFIGSREPSAVITGPRLSCGHKSRVHRDRGREKVVQFWPEDCTKYQNCSIECRKYSKRRTEKARASRLCSDAEGLLLKIVTGLAERKDHWQSRKQSCASESSCWMLGQQICPILCNVNTTLVEPSSQSARCSKIVYSKKDSLISPLTRLTGFSVKIRLRFLGRRFLIYLTICGDSWIISIKMLQGLKSWELFFVAKTSKLASLLWPWSSWELWNYEIMKSPSISGCLH